ncbi:MAG TPA: MarR family transcriptional regulator [Actinomycetes bacterium]|nr:MarR family transcriptional regulator [Actinomycetes bacterium]
MTRADGVLASDLRIAVMRLARRLRAERADLDLTITQLAALASLERHGPTTPGQLASIERVRPPSMTRILAGLEARGLVSRAPHATDGRQVVVDVTNEAKSMLRADRRRREAWLSQRLATLSAGDLDALRSVVPVIEQLVAE